MSGILPELTAIVLIIYVGLLAMAVWQLWRGKTVADRLIGVDLVTTLLLSILILLAIIQRDNIFLDLALAMAALGFISTLALAKYMADEQMF